MAEDENFTRFFCFLSLFAAAMLGVVIANNLLLLFMCWELVGLASYLLIGILVRQAKCSCRREESLYCHAQSVTSDLFIGILWLYFETGTLLFYDQRQRLPRCLLLSPRSLRNRPRGMLVSTAIALLIFCGADRQVRPGAAARLALRTRWKDPRRSAH
jgi:NADH-quinone oxidoreductase subunit L